MRIQAHPCLIRVLESKVRCIATVVAGRHRVAPHTTMESRSSANGTFATPASASRLVGGMVKGRYPGRSPSSEGNTYTALFTSRPQPSTADRHSASSRSILQPDGRCAAGSAAEQEIRPSSRACTRLAVERCGPGRRCGGCQKLRSGSAVSEGRSRLQCRLRLGAAERPISEGGLCRRWVKGQETGWGGRDLVASSGREASIAEATCFGCGRQSTQQCSLPLFFAVMLIIKLHTSIEKRH